MNLFRIFGTIAIKNKEANEAIDETTDKAEKSHGRLKSVFSSIGSAAVKFGKVAATATLAVATGIATMTAGAVKNYAEYEQLVGGVETLFKNSSSKVVEYANNAYKTAGMSANQYMNTVTSFSASLLQSLDGDTKAAAEKANVAITDMSDNANKMGTSMESIQNAYQGFAKQNYTMLDNLKLGYGGTKEEMQRLLEDAEKLSGQKFDLSSYADIVDAIHVVQKEMGISGITAEEAAEAVKNGSMTQEEAFNAMGTTAKEAATTIQGSIGMMKAAWTNLMTGMADPEQNMDTLLNNLVDSVMSVADNLVPRIAATLPRIVTGISELVQKLAPYIPPLLQQLIPSLIQGATSLLSEIVNNLPGILDTLLPGIGGQIGQSLTTALNSIFGTLTSILPSLLQLIEPILSAAADLLAALLPPLMQIIQAILPPLTDLIKMLLPPIVQIIQLVLPVLVSLLTPVLALLQPIFELLTPFLTLITTLLEPLMSLINMILPPIIELLSMLIDEYLSVLQPIIQWYADFLSGVLNGAIQLIITVITNCRESFAAAWQGIKTVWSVAGDFFKGIWSKISAAFSAVGSFFGNVFKAGWNAIQTAFSPVVGFFKKVWDGIKNIFSKVGATIGNAITNTVKTAINGVLSTAIKIINGFISAINLAISVINAIPGVSISKLDKLSTPKLEKGGVLKKGQVGILEGNGAEAVVPLEKNKEWISKVADDMERTIGSGGSSEQLDRIIRMLDMLITMLPDALAEAVRQLKLEINKREFGRLVKEVST